MDHSIIMAVQDANDPPESLWIDYWGYITALISEQNTVMVVKQRLMRHSSVSVTKGLKASVMTETYDI